MPGYGSRYWAERTSAGRRRSYPKLRGSHAADAVIIGGGLAGTTAAYVLAAGGMDVILVEADRLACGSTAGALGAILPEPDAAFRSVDALAGRRVARTAWKDAHRSAADFAGALRKLNIKCDLAPAAYVINARSADEAAWLRRDQAARRASGVVAPWITPQAVREESSLESAGALKPGAAFTFDPVRAALGLAVAAEAKGARIFEQSVVRRTRFTRKYADVVLTGATIRTRGVIVATGEPGVPFAQLRRHVRRQSGYAVVTEPLSAAMRREVGRRASVVTEATDADRRWLRWLPEDRVLFAGALSARPSAQQRHRALVQRTAQLMYELSVRYPVISGLPAHWGWETEIVTTPDGLPWVGPHRNYPFHFFALGFGWHGDGIFWLAAKAALRYLTGESRKDDEAFGFVRHLS